MLWLFEDWLLKGSVYGQLSLPLFFFFETRLKTGTMSLLSHAIGQSKSKGHLDSVWGNRLLLLIEVLKSHVSKDVTTKRDRVLEPYM